MVTRSSCEFRGPRRYLASSSKANNRNNNNVHGRHQYRQAENDVLRQLLRLIASEPILMILLCVWNVIAILGVVILTQRLQNEAKREFLTSSIYTKVDIDATNHDNSNSYDTVILPDLRYFGYTPEQIYTEFYNPIGHHGCSIYSTLALWDICILVPAYILLLGTVYVHVTRYTYDQKMTTTIAIWKSDDDTYEKGYWNADQRVSYLLLPIAICDWTETLLQRRGCTLLPEQQLSVPQVQIASIAVSMKWFLLGLLFLSILERLYRVIVGNILNSKQRLSNTQRLLPL
jgi:hypothetical protein